MGHESFFKLIVIGPSAAGKTSLVHRFANDVFVDNRPTTMGCDFVMKVLDHSPALSKATSSASTGALARSTDGTPTTRW